MEYLLGIDIGTSGTKTVLFDRDANPITAKTFEYPLYQEQNGWAEQEPADWWNAVVQGVQAVLQASGVDAADIKGIGLSGQMHGLVMLDENGEEASFVHVLTVVYEGQKYVALEPAEQQDDEEAEVVLLKVDTKDGQDYYNTIDNEILLNEVFDEFLDIVEEMEGEDEEE